MEGVAVVILVIVAAVLLAAAMGRRLRFRRRPHKPKPWKYIPERRDEPTRTAPDAADQLRIVMRAPFSKQRLMSRAEYDVFRAVEKHLRTCGPGFRLMAQPSMGEFLSSPDKDAYLSINSKRVDMLVIDTFGMPAVAIEHQGSGHYQNDAPARDAVKREAMRRAGIEFLEIFDYHAPADIGRLLAEAIARNKPPASPSAIPPRQTS